MKKTIIWLIIAVAAACALPSGAWAQQTKTVVVRFARGKTERTYFGYLSRSVDSYKFVGKKGQTVKIKVISPNGVALFHFNRTRKDGTYENIATDQTDYTYEITADDAALYANVGALRGSTRYSIRITIE